MQINVAQPCERHDYYIVSLGDAVLTAATPKEVKMAKRALANAYAAGAAASRQKIRDAFSDIFEPAKPLHP